VRQTPATVMSAAMGVNPPAAVLVCGPKMTVSGLGANASTGNLNDITKIHSSGNAANNNHALKNTATVTRRPVVR